MERKKIILAVDDMLLNLRTVEVLLGACFDVRKAKSAELALKILASNHVDLILLDIEMPGMGGFDFLKMIKSSPNTADIPVVFVTSRASSEFVARAKHEGAIDYIMKPFMGGVLETRVCKLLNVTDVYISPDGKLLPMPSNLLKTKRPPSPAPAAAPSAPHPVDAAMDMDFSKEPPPVDIDMDNAEDFSIDLG